MRIDVKKYLFIGIKSNQSAFFASARDLGIIHFVETPSKTRSEIPSDIQNLKDAIKILDAFPCLEQEECQHDIVNTILELQHRVLETAEKGRLLTLEIARISPFGNYSSEEMSWIEKETQRKFQFYCAKQHTITDTDLPQDVMYVATEANFDYFLALNAAPRQFDKMLEIKPEGSLDELKQQKKLLEQVYSDNHAKLRSFARYKAQLQQQLLEKLDQNHLACAECDAHSEMDGQLFVVEGWVPEDRIDRLHNLSHELQVHYEEISIESTDIIPTCLKNEGFSRIGEDLVQIYDTPSVNDKDPSLWVLFSFALFFSMIIGDAGYGLVLLLGTLFMNYKIVKKTPSMSRFIKLSMILSIFCVSWGLLSTSFFGISIAPDSAIRKFSLTSWLIEKKTHYHFTLMDGVAQNWLKKLPGLTETLSPTEILKAAPGIYAEFSDQIMLELALFVGAVHMSLSLMRNLKRNFSGIGWIIFIVGGYLYFPEFLDAVTLSNYAFGIERERGIEIGFWLIIGGISLAVTLAIIRDKVRGILEVMNVIQIFADAMSYLRLYALALSGALIVATLNEVSAELNIILASFLLIIGHSVNLVLCIMGGVIHGLRLNFLEWYHYSFEGGGKQYNPLKALLD